jgi:four helix bundle protein
MEAKPKIASYTDLVVWQEARKLVKLTYRTTDSFPDGEKFGLTNQMRRAAISVPSNIAEGFGRSTAKDKNNFYYMAKGSLAELETQAYLASDVSLMNDTQLDKILGQAATVHKLLHGLIKANKERL